MPSVIENTGDSIVLIKHLKQGLNYLRNQEIDIRIRMLFLLEYATVVACLIGSIPILFYTSSFVVLIPNIALMIFGLLGIYFSHVRKKYDSAVNLIIIGCAYVTLPIMFFTAGGNHSGMPLWFMFGVIFSCMMARGKARIYMPAIAILILSLCMGIAYMRPDFVIPLPNKQSEFIDMLQSFVIVSIMVCISLIAYLASYDKQRTMLEVQRQELQQIMNVDALTGIANRRAYYERTGYYTDTGYEKDVVVAAMDLNGLKKVNDTLGHSAGDAMIKTAAGIIRDAFSKYGDIYRTGGDEFMAILKCPDSEAVRLDEILRDSIRASSSELADGMTIAVGTAIWNMNKNVNFTELEKMADTAMYENKTRYYQETGIDRRGR